MFSIIFWFQLPIWSVSFTTVCWIVDAYLTHVFRLMGSSICSRLHGNFLSATLLTSTSFCRPRQVISAINIPLSVMLAPVLACRLVKSFSLYLDVAHSCLRSWIFVNAAPKLCLILKALESRHSQRSRWPNRALLTLLLATAVRLEAAMDAVVA